MASDQQQQQQQLRRDENKGGEERVSFVEKDIVPKLTIHFESLAKDSGIAGDQNRGEGIGTGEEQHEREKTQLGKDKNQTPLPIEEISKVKATAQQKIMEAIRAAEEKAANAAVQVGRDERDRGTGEEQERETQSGEGRGERGTTGEPQCESLGGKVTNMHVAGGCDKDEKEKEKEKASEADRQTGREMDRKDEEEEEEEGDQGEKNKDQTLSLEEISKLRGVAQQKSTEAIRVAEEKAANAAAKAKETSPSTLQKVKETAAQTAVKVAADVKDKAVAAGWGVAHLTAEAAVQGTKMAVRAVEGVAGYAGETVMSVGYTVVGVGGKQVEKVRDTAAATGETVKEYTARKQEEAKRDLEAKKLHEQEEGEEKCQGMMEKVEHYVGGGGEGEKGREEGQETRQECQQEGDTGVLGAIGETVVEIAQTAKGLVIGEEAGYKSSSTMEQTKQGERGQAGSG